MQAEDFDLWMIVTQRPFMPTKTKGKGKKVAKGEKEFNDDDKKMLKKNAKAKLNLYNVSSPEEINRISTCNTANEI